MMAVINGDNGNNRIVGTNQADLIHGRGGNDLINAQNGADQVFGDEGDDNIGGGGGNDFMDGGIGNDYAQGGSGGDDTLYGGAGTGRDRLVGDAPRGDGVNNDTFLYSSTEGNDRILDFSGSPATQDVLDLTEADSAQIAAVYGSTIQAGDVGVSNVNGTMVIDFGPAPFPPFAGSGVLALDNFGAGVLQVGVDVV
jgi:Ca2+-binding RTX toxin-like protein